MEPKFEPIRIDRQDEYRGLLKATPQSTSDYAFANLWGWAVHYGLEWTFVYSLCWIRQTKPETIYWAPVGDWMPTIGEVAPVWKRPQTSSVCRRC